MVVANVKGIEENIGHLGDFFSLFNGSETPDDHLEMPQNEEREDYWQKQDKGVGGDQVEHV